MTRQQLHKRMTEINDARGNATSYEDFVDRITEAYSQTIQLVTDYCNEEAAE